MDVLALDVGEEPDTLVVEEPDNDLARTPFSFTSSKNLKFFKKNFKN